MITKSSSFSRIMILVGIILSLFIGYFGGYIVKNYEAISDPRVFFNMTSSIGTILSASIALSLGVYPILKSYVEKPNLVPTIIELGQTFESMEQGFYDFEWGISLENTGKETAKNITLKIKNVQSLNEEIFYRLTYKPLREKFDLAWNDYQIASLIYLGPMYDDARINTVETADFGFKDCIIDLLITGDSFTGSIIKLKYTHSEIYDKTKLEIIR